MNFLSFLSTLIDLVFPIPLKQIVKSEPVNACTPKKKNSQNKKKKSTLKDTFSVQNIFQKIFGFMYSLGS